ncbi:MAG: hypothetical protein RR764_10515 [Oscillospiraceae bacterium]
MNLEQPLTLVNLVQTFENGGIYIALFVVALLYLYLKGTDTDKKVFVYAALFLLLTVFNPFFIWLAIEAVPNEKSTYYRYIWLLPVLIVIAYAVSKLLIGKFSKKQKVSIVCVFALLVVLFGSPVTNEIWAQGKPENIYKIPDSVLATCTIIENNKEEERPTAVFDNSIGSFVRQYDAFIQMPFVYYPSYVSDVARLNVDEAKFLNDAMYTKESIDIVMLENSLNIFEIDFVVTFVRSKLSESLIEIGYNLVGGYGEYGVFKRSYA